MFVFVPGGAAVSPEKAEGKSRDAAVDFNQRRLRLQPPLESNPYLRLCPRQKTKLKLKHVKGVVERCPFIRVHAIQGTNIISGPIQTAH
jgi:hypothetical protein